MGDENDIDDWASTEFGAANLGDARLARRLVALARRLACSPQGSLPQSLSPAELKAAYRFFDNAQVDTDGILAPHITQTLNRLNQVPVVLAVQDTTEFNLTHLGATQGLGYLSGNTLSSRGFMMHSLLAVTPEGLPLGVLGMKTWVRPDEEFGKKRQRATRPFSDKESTKWIEGIAHLAALKQQCVQTRLISVGDRENDLYDLFACARPEGVDWLIRAAYNRRTRHAEGYLWETVLACPVMGHSDLLVSAKHGLPERTARLTLRCVTVQLRPPAKRASRLPEVEVFAIHATEDNAPPGIEPLEWMLLTSVPTTTLDEALERLAWYAQRWTIETWHRVLKSGCRIEARQFGNIERFVRATALFAVIGWRILYATLLSRTDPDLCCEVLLQPVEWQALYCRTHHTNRPPKRPPKLLQALLWIAMLGGYLNRKHDRPPGPTVIWRGFLILHEITSMYCLFRQNE
ncbi:IS4 family transposase [uncultured Ralstonia sp.]|uniref:IS4 family transposase n=1 Tax=uncultured Ralstonia sp. TaxID=114715 RepID=UPI0025F98370|nr:IS4 family transposase [uncultured Ralstonia sp.]